MNKIILILSSLLLSFSALAESGRFLLDGMEAPVYYDASKSIEEGDPGRTVLILIHGWGSGLKANTGLLAVGESLGGIYAVCPCFPRPEVMEKMGVEPDGRALWNASWSKDLSKRGNAGDDWRGGGDAEGTAMSSFDVIDAILAKLSDRTLYPNLKRVVISGFSAGGQFVGRYVAVGKGFVRDGVKVEYAAMSPSTQFRFDPEMPWHYGIADRPRYSRSLTERQIMKNLTTRRVFCGCGDKDVTPGSLDVTPEAMSQGANRFERYLSFKRHVEAWPRWKRNLTFHTFEGIAHESGKAYKDPVLIKYLKGDRP